MGERDTHKKSLPLSRTKEKKNRKKKKIEKKKGALKIKKDTRAHAHTNYARKALFWKTKKTTKKKEVFARVPRLFVFLRVFTSKRALSFV